VSRRPHFCPACRRPFPPALTVHGPVRQRIVDLIANRPDGITRAEIINTVYAADINGGPTNENVVAVLIKHANKELAAQGFQIVPTWRGRGARYRLVEIAPLRAVP
jgi:DNA-binding response OmpR family regulator